MTSNGSAICVMAGLCAERPSAHCYRKQSLRDIPAQQDVVVGGAGLPPFPLSFCTHLLTLSAPADV